MHLVKPECLVEDNIDYAGNDINDGTLNRQPDVASCQSFCTSNYPSSPYFVWVSPSASWTGGHDACYCKNTNAGRVKVTGITSGRVSCDGGEKQFVPHTILVTTLFNFSIILDDESKL